MDFNDFFTHLSRMMIKADDDYRDVTTSWMTDCSSGVAYLFEFYRRL